MHLDLLLNYFLRPKPTFEQAMIFSVSDVESTQFNNATKQAHLEKYLGILYLKNFAAKEKCKDPICEYTIFRLIYFFLTEILVDTNQVDSKVLILIYLNLWYMLNEIKKSVSSDKDKLDIEYIIFFVLTYFFKDYFTRYNVDWKRAKDFFNKVFFNLTDREVYFFELNRDLTWRKLGFNVSTLLHRSNVFNVKKHILNKLISLKDNVNDLVLHVAYLDLKKSFQSIYISFYSLARANLIDTTVDAAVGAVCINYLLPNFFQKLFDGTISFTRYFFTDNTRLLGLFDVNKLPEFVTRLPGIFFTKTDNPNLKLVSSVLFVTFLTIQYFIIKKSTNLTVNITTILEKVYRNFYATIDSSGYFVTNLSKDYFMNLKEYIFGANYDKSLKFEKVRLVCVNCDNTCQNIFRVTNIGPIIIESPVIRGGGEEDDIEKEIINNEIGDRLKMALKTKLLIAVLDEDMVQGLIDRKQSEWVISDLESEKFKADYPAYFPNDCKITVLDEDTLVNEGIDFNIEIQKGGGNNHYLIKEPLTKLEKRVLNCVPERSSREIFDNSKLFNFPYKSKRTISRRRKSRRTKKITRRKKSKKSKKSRRVTKKKKLL